MADEKNLNMDDLENVVGGTGLKMDAKDAPLKTPDLLTERFMEVDIAPKTPEQKAREDLKKEGPP